MRLLGSLEHYVLLGGGGRVVLHQYVAGRFTAPVAGGEVALDVATDYPWDGAVTVRVVDGPDTEWELRRLPDPLRWAAEDRR